MQPLNAILLQSDPATTQALIAPLRQAFRSVRQAQSLDDLRTSMATYHPQLVILDLETTSFLELARLSRDFPAVRIVCNHRLADEPMWIAALNAGAADCCRSNDAQEILRAALQNQSAAMAA